MTLPPEQSEALLAAITWLAGEKTIDEIMSGKPPLDWANASTERRIEMMGERKRAHDAAVLNARIALRSLALQPGGEK